MTAIMSQLIRIGLILAVIAAVAAAVLYFIGGGSRTHTAAIQIDAPPGAVYDLIVTRSARAQWSERIERIEPLADGNAESDDSSRLTINAGGRSYSAIEKILEKVPAESVLLELRSPQANERCVFVLREGSQGKTAVEYTVIYKALGVERLTNTFRRDEIPQRMAAELKALKQQAEGEGKT